MGLGDDKYHFLPESVDWRGGGRMRKGVESGINGIGR
jgi:hypothetical protein